MIGGWGGAFEGVGRGVSRARRLGAKRRVFIDDKGRSSMGGRDRVDGGAEKEDNFDSFRLMGGGSIGRGDATGAEDEMGNWARAREMLQMVLDEG